MSVKRTSDPEYFRLANHRKIDGKVAVRSRRDSAWPIKSLFFLKVVPEVIDPVMGSFQIGCIKRQIRTIEATNIRVMNLLLVLYPFIDRLQAGDRLVKPLRK